MTTEGLKRPWSSRYWFYRPQWEWTWGWIKTWVWRPYYRGGDEFDWHTIVLGFPWTGQVVIATKPCPNTGACFEPDPEFRTDMAEWPIDLYGNNHLTGERADDSS